MADLGARLALCAFDRFHLHRPEAAHLPGRGSQGEGAFEDRVAALPEVMSGFQMPGDAGCTLRVALRDLDPHQPLLSRLTRIPGVTNIQSRFALKSVIRRNPLQL